MRKAVLIVLGGVCAAGFIEGCGGGNGVGAGGDGGGGLATASAFRDQYCALIAPCCAAAGLPAQCPAAVDAAAGAGTTYDAWAGNACVDGLRARQSSPDFCAGIGSSLLFGPSWYPAIPACNDVFRIRGNTPGGQSCSQDLECAPPQNGDAICVTNFDNADGGISTTQVCLQMTTGNVGDACIGTVSFDPRLTTWIPDPAPAQGNFCAHAKNLICDESTGVCKAAGAVGDPCTNVLGCAADAYCVSARCAARLPLGASCANMLGECREPGSCDTTTMTCTAPLVAGAACTTAASACASFSCVNGACASALASLCAP